MRQRKARADMGFGASQKADLPCETTESSIKLRTNVASLKEELEEILEQLPVDEDTSKRKLQEVAAAMYEAIDPGEYESCRLCSIFGKEIPRDTLDARLIGQTIVYSTSIRSMGKCSGSLFQRRAERGGLPDRPRRIPSNWFRFRLCPSTLHRALGICWTNSTGRFFLPGVESS